MRCVECDCPVNADEATFAPHPNHPDLVAYCPDCVPPEMEDHYADS